MDAFHCWNPMQVFVPWASLLVPALDPYNDYSDRTPWLKMALDKGVIQPKDVLIVNQVGNPHVADEPASCLLIPAPDPYNDYLPSGIDEVFLINLKNAIIMHF
jgi:hypothetical protein